MERQFDVSAVLLRLDRATEHLQTLRDEIAASEKPKAVALFGDKELETGRAPASTPRIP